MSYWLLDRLFETGNQPKPRFALQGTVNWMHALSLIIKSGTCEKQNLKEIYSKVQRRTLNKEADNYVFENMHMAYSNLASLNALTNESIPKYDISSTAIVSWYYTIYFACSAMNAAASGSKQEDHASTARVWQADIVEKGLIPYPFNLYLSSLIQETADAEINSYRKENKYDLNTRANNLEIAYGNLISYLNGTKDYEKWKVEVRVRDSKEFKKQKFENFRKKAARQMRDKKLENKKVNFLVQAFRYRGKAHYRDSIFLSYGDNNIDLINQLILDLYTVADGFVKAAAYYCSMRVEKDVWNKFITDVESHTRLSLDIEPIKGR